MQTLSLEFWEEEREKKLVARFTVIFTLQINTSTEFLFNSNNHQS